MKVNHIKLLAIAIFTLPIFAIAIFNTGTVGAVAIAPDETADLYKAKCAMCHKPDASKFYDPALPHEEQVEAVLKGKKGEKPPNMPAFEAKGITPEQAEALVNYMMGLRNPDGDAATNTNCAPEDGAAEVPRETTLATYKAKCSMCHKPDASKFYDPALSEAEQVEAILKGKKGEKPPNMPGFEEKGITEPEATALAKYMIELNTPAQ